VLLIRHHAIEGQTKDKRIDFLRSSFHGFFLLTLSPSSFVSSTSTSALLAPPPKDSFHHLQNSNDDYCLSYIESSFLTLNHASYESEGKQ
jgi:hypothetical protein